MEGYAYCTCNAGFYGDGKKYCFPNCGLGYWPDEFTGECNDIDECLTMTHSCAIRADCTNNPGSYECACQDGYLGDGRSCADDNECYDGSAGCHFDAECIDNEGSFRCECRIGFFGDGFMCEDLNECSQGISPCGPLASCVEERGGYQCVCGDVKDFKFHAKLKKSSI